MGRIAVIDAESTWGKRVLSGDCTYCEVHNTFCDAMDELTNHASAGPQHRYVWGDLT